MPILLLFYSKTLLMNEKGSFRKEKANIFSTAHVLSFVVMP